MHTISYIWVGVKPICLLKQVHRFCMDEKDDSDFSEDYNEKRRTFKQRARAWLLWVGSDIRQDVRRRIPFYISDWTDAYNYRVVPATVYMFFANILPAIAFAQDLFDRTNGAYGVNEVLMGSAMGGIVFGLFAGQPLTIVGVTGPICIFSYTIFDIITPKGVNYFAFMTWVAIWSFIMHTLIAVFNGVRFMRYVTMYSCDVFGCFINIIYVEKGIQILIRQFKEDSASPAAYFQIVTALCILIFGVSLVMVAGNVDANWGFKWMRKIVADYSLPLLVVFFTGFTYFPGRISLLKKGIQRLPVNKAFQPSEVAKQYGREYGWFIHFWDIKVGYVFLAIPFAILLTLLFYFDHNISAIMAQAPTHVFKKPASFHYDFLVLGITTLVAGFLGILPPNGLIPQAPLHVESLGNGEFDEEGKEYVVEQRMSNFLQGLGTIGLMTGPLLHVLHLVPEGVLAGLFFMMGIPGLLGNELIRRLLLLIRDRTKSCQDPIASIPTKTLVEYLIVSAIGVAGEVAITQTIAAIGFPLVMLILMLIGLVLPRYFRAAIDVLDSPAADPYIMDTLK